MSTELIVLGQASGAAIWALAGILPLVRRSVRGPALWAFATFCLALSAYAVVDLLYLGASTAEEALALVRGRMLAIGIAVAALVLFARWLLVRRRRSDLALLVPPAVMLGLVGLIAVDVVPTEWGYAPVRPLGLYVAWIVYLYAYAGLGAYYLVTGTRDFRGQYSLFYAGARVIAASILGLMVVGFGGNVLFNLMGARQIPLFSALLFLPGLAMLTVTGPLTRDRIAALVRHLAVAHKEVQHAFLVYQGGTLIAARSQVPNGLQDEDVFAAVFEALQHYARFRLDPFGGGRLDAIDQGDVKILVERGRYSYLVLVTTGRENELLRGEMHHLLERFETRNVTTLSQWSGDTGQLEGAQETVEVLCRMDQVF